MGRQKSSIFWTELSGVDFWVRVNKFRSESIKLIMRRREQLKFGSKAEFYSDYSTPKQGPTNQNFQNKCMLSASVSFLPGSGKIPQTATCTLSKYANNAFPLLHSEKLGLWMKNTFYKALHLTRGRVLPFESENRDKGFSALIRAPRRKKKHVPNLTEEISKGFSIKMEFIPTN